MDELDAFTYQLPPDLIAQEPLAVRHASRLMYVNRGTSQIEHYQFLDLVDLLTPKDVLVLNDTKVIPARLWARRATGGLVEILLLRPHASAANMWRAMATPLRRLKPGDCLVLEPTEPDAIHIRVADIITDDYGHKQLVLDLGLPEDVYKLLSTRGFAPLPPYIQRNQSEPQRISDLERYQTLFANAPGAVAAPTAGLHFSSDLLNKIEQKGITLARLTLHVGPGTFKPITTSVNNHFVESERYSIPAQTADIINQALAEGRRIIAVGTTSCRALESAGASGLLESQTGSETSLYIKPGHQFRIISGLITNFHLSRSSLLVLVSAFAGYNLTMHAYNTAIESRYRFYSYGDAMFIT